MKRKLVNIAIFLPLLVCLMGANTIDWDVGQPNPNPKGATLTIEGKGTYKLDPGYSVVNIHFYWQLTGQQSASSKQAAHMGGNWESTTTVSTAGQYECWASMAAYNGVNLKVANTPTPNPQINVK